MCSAVLGDICLRFDHHCDGSLAQLSDVRSQRRDAERRVICDLDDVQAHLTDVQRRANCIYAGAL